MSQTHLCTYSTEISWNDVRQQELMSSLDQSQTRRDRLSYSSQENLLILNSSPDVSRVLWKTCFLWIHCLSILPGPHSSPNTSKAWACGLWGNITTTWRALNRFPSVSLHPGAKQRKGTQLSCRGRRPKLQRWQMCWNLNMHTKTWKQTCSYMGCLKCFVTAAEQYAWFAPPCSLCAHQAFSCTSATAHVLRGFTPKTLCKFKHFTATLKIIVAENMFRIHPKFSNWKRLGHGKRKWELQEEVTLTSSYLG